MPGVVNKSAMIAVHEKGRHSFKCVAKPLVGGHTGLNPVKDNPVERMSYFIRDVKKTKTNHQQRRACLKVFLLQYSVLKLMTCIFRNVPNRANKDRLILPFFFFF